MPSDREVNNLERKIVSDYPHSDSKNKKEMVEVHRLNIQIKVQEIG